MVIHTDTKRTNWAGNIHFQAARIHYPETIEHVQDIVRKADHIRALGSGHSFNPIADSAAEHISLEKMNKIIGIDEASSTVTIEGGVRYGELAPYLYAHGYALHNMASLPHISVVGAIVTATHGSGLANGNLATAVTALEFVNAAGEIVSVSRKDGDEFYGAVVSLGIIGIVTKVSLSIMQSFQMKQTVYLDLPMRELEHNFEALQSKAYSVSLFTNWHDKTINQVWIKSRIDEKSVMPEDLDLYDAKPANHKVHPVKGHSPSPLTEQMGIPGPWHERMPHFKAGFRPSVGNELQSEYFIPLEHAYAAIMAVESIRELIEPHIFISEIRTVAADSLWMSPSYKKLMVGIHMTWRCHGETIKNILPILEEHLGPFNPIPHWAKLFTMDPTTVQAKYTRLNDFKRLVSYHDPHGKFRNEFIRTLLYRNS